MKNYLTVEQLDKNKTYYSYVDVAVSFSDKDTLFMEKLPSNKNEMNSIIKMMNPIKSEPESPIKTFLFLLKLKGRYAKMIPMSSKHNPK